MVQVFALEINLRATKLLGQAFRKIQRGGAADKFGEVVGQFLLKFRVVLRAEIFSLQLLQRVHQRLGHITSAIGTKVALGIG